MEKSSTGEHTVVVVDEEVVVDPVELEASGDASCRLQLNKKLNR